MIRKRPEKDTVNPPGQVVYKPCPSKEYKPVHGGYPTPQQQQWNNYEKSRNGSN